jgi:small redox-active disulfide protein 2
MEIKILGPGCPKCKILDSLVRKVVAENNIDATVIKVDDIVEIMKYGIMVTPALLVDGRIVMKGKVPSEKEILSYLK